MEQFIAEIEAYAAACGLKPTTVVQGAAGVSGAAWDRWKAGGSCTMRTADRIRDYIRENPAPSPNQSPADAADADQAPTKDVA